MSDLHWNYLRALQELWDRSSYERGLITDPFGDVDRAERGLVRMRALLTALEDPHAAIPLVHVAGSKGKGTTAHLTASVATAAGHRVGLYTSPHLHRFPERIAIDGLPVSDEAFAALAQRVAAAATHLEATDPNLGGVTTFEMVTAMGFRAFVQAGCDLAVIEVGLGGRYDSTNVVDPIVSVITRIDLEHTAVLGPTYREIAFQKAGIVRPGIPCVSSPQVPEAAAEIARVAQMVGAPLFAGNRDWTWSGSWREFAASGPWGDWRALALGLPGAHQIENACTALAALHFVNHSGLAIPESAARAGLRETHWPGRFEVVTVGSQRVVFDGAHTPAAARALVATWRDERLPANAAVVLGMGADKDIAAFLAGLRPLVGRLLITRADSPRAADPEAIATVAEAMGIPNDVYPTVAAAIAAVQSRGEPPILVTGSLFVAAEGREAFGLAAPDPLWRAAAPGAAGADAAKNAAIPGSTPGAIR